MTLEHESISLLFDNFYFTSGGYSNSKGVNITTDSKIRVKLVFYKMPDADEIVFLNKILDAARIKDYEYEKKLIDDIPKEDLISQAGNWQGVVIYWGDEINEDEKYIIIKSGKNVLLSADSLKKINTNQDLKAKLWKCLKSIFLE